MAYAGASRASPLRDQPLPTSRQRPRQGFAFGTQDGASAGATQCLPAAHGKFAHASRVGLADAEALGVALAVALAVAGGAVAVAVAGVFAEAVSVTCASSGGLDDPEQAARETVRRIEVTRTMAIAIL